MKFLQTIINNLSIKQKLIALSMATSTIAIVIVCSVFIIFTITAERNDLVEETRAISKIYAEELSWYIINKHEATKFLEMLKNYKFLTQVCVYTDDSKEFANFVLDSNRSRSCNSIPVSTGKYRFNKDSSIGEYLLVSRRIIHGNHKIGYLTMVANLDKINERIFRSIFTSAALFIIIISISYIISRILQRTISAPILHLADVSYIVKSGDYNVRAHHHSNDELGVLTEAYNNMLKEIQYAKEHLEEKVKERTQDLEKVMQVKVQFLSNMSHEIRTPIHGIMNYVDFLVHDWDSLDKDQKYVFIKKLHNNSLRLLSLINNLLDLSKLDAGKLEFCMQKDNMTKVIEEIIVECEALYMQNQDISIDFNYDKEQTYYAVFDQERIVQVMRNILSNAIKFTQKGKIIITMEHIKYKKQNGNKVQAIQVSISDEGVGIPENELESIFDRFNQSANTKTGAGGTGLGLTISKEIIKAHQGAIWAKNNVSKVGSTFFFVIPIKQHKIKV